MIFKNSDKEALKKNDVSILSRITIVDTGRVFTENDFINEWTYEDFRYVPDKGFIGEFIEKIFDGKLLKLPQNINLENKELKLELGIANNMTNETTFYNFGNYMVTDVSKEDTTGYYNFESCDYTKKFNITYVDDITYPCTSLEMLNNVCLKAGVQLENNGYCYMYIVNDNELPSGNYNINVGDMYYNFTISNKLEKNSTLKLIINENKLIQKRIDDNYNVIYNNINFTKSSTKNGTTINCRQMYYCDFINNDFVIEGNPFNDDKTLREIVKDIAKLAYSWARINNNNKLVIDFNNNTDRYVDIYNTLTTDEYYTSKKNDEYFGGVNKVLIGMSSVEGENIYKTSSDYTPETECCIKIYDNDLTYTEDLRRIAINGCEKLFGLIYNPVSIETIGHPWFEGDDYIILNNLDGEEIYTYPFNRKLIYNGYIKGYIESEGSTSISSKYDYDGGIDSKIRRTEFIVDKQNQVIQGVITDVGEQNSKIASISLNVDELNSKIQNIANVTTSGETSYASLSLTNVNESEPIYIRIYPINNDISYLYPHNNLIPNENLFGKTRILRFYNTKDNTTYDYEIPDDLFYYNEEIYDDFVLDYEKLNCVINKRVGINENGETYKLNNPVTSTYEFPKIILTNGDYTISLIGYSNGYISARLMASNIYTSQFATKTEVSSQIKQTVDTINLGINAKLENYSTKIETNNAISQSITESENTIKSEVSNIYITKSDSEKNINNAKNEAIDEANNSTDEKLKDYPTTTEMNNSITQKINDKENVIMSNVSATYITKKDSATNIGNAKNEAINSANSSTDNKLKSYSTTTQMNNAITQKVNDKENVIMSNVSSTYITKKDSATNISDAKTEAINSANSSTDNKLKNYSTTTQMNNAITQKVNSSESSILSSVSATYITKTDSATNISTAKNEAINSANSSTDNKLKNYSTTTQMNNTISQRVNESQNSIMLEVNKKTTMDEVDDVLKDYDTTSEVNAKLELKIDTNDNDKVVSMINASADKININSNSTTIKSNGYALENGKLSITDVASGTGGDLSIQTATINEIYWSWDNTIHSLMSAASQFTVPTFGFYNIKGKTETFYINRLYSNKLQISGEAGIYRLSATNGNINSLNFSNGKGGNLTVYGFNNFSQEELKKNFEKLNNALDIIDDIDIYKYNYKCEEDDNKKHIGMVIGENYNYSQEITNDKNEAVDVYAMVSVCLQAIKEQQKEIEELKNEIEHLKEK